MMLTGLRILAWMNVTQAPLEVVAEASADRCADFSHAAFVCKLRLQILPNDREHREGFDIPTNFRIGNPNVHFHAAAAQQNYMKSQGIMGPFIWLHLGQDVPLTVPVDSICSGRQS